MLAQQFGHLIKDRRARKGLTQVDLARSARVSRTVLSRLEQGNASAVQTDVLDRILAVLDVRAGVVDAGGGAGRSSRASTSRTAAEADTATGAAPPPGDRVVR